MTARRDVLEGRRPPTFRIGEIVEKVEEYL
jgi:hypothetical protein